MEGMIISMPIHSVQLHCLCHPSRAFSYQTGVGFIVQLFEHKLGQQVALASIEMISL